MSNSNNTPISVLIYLSRNYVVEKRDLNSGAWVPVSSFVTGTSLVVPKLQEGHQYEFRVMAENSFGTSEPLVTDSPVTAKNPYDTPKAPGQPEIKETDRDHIDIEWDRPISDGGSPITHYEVERRDLKSDRWVKVNSSPVKVSCLMSRFHFCFLTLRRIALGNKIPRRESYRRPSI